MILKAVAARAIKMRLTHDDGRLNPMAGQAPLRSQIETRPRTNRIGTSLGTIVKDVVSKDQGRAQD